MKTLEDFMDIGQSQTSSIVRDVTSFYSRNYTLWKEIGHHFKTPDTYLHEFKLRFPDIKISHQLLNRGLNFANNKQRPIHRWTNYLEGFSESFVYDIIERFGLSSGHRILDPFAGSGTVNVAAMMKGIDSAGIEINPTIFRVLLTKTSWDTNPREIQRRYDAMDFSKKASVEAPAFLETEKQFQPEILENVLRIKEQVGLVDDPRLRCYFELAFVSVLLPSSNLRRSPSIGYDKKKIKNLYPDLPFQLFEQKVKEIIKDLQFVQAKVEKRGKSISFCEDSKAFTLPEDITIDAVITSPPYLNSFDYVGNYKLEIGWMEDAASTKDLGELRDRMVLCDNVSRSMMKSYAEQSPLLSIDWLDYIIAASKPRMRERIGIRRKDYPILLRKYFEDIYMVLSNMYKSINDGARVAWVVGDSLILDVYVPTDLITMMIAQKIGYRPTGIEIDRTRRSGIRRTFTLRESILYFQKET
jgi:DNA modification methylase